MPAENVRLADLSTGPISTYQQIVPITSSTSTYPTQVAGWVHTVSVVSQGTYGANSPPGLLKDGYTSVDAVVIGVIDPNAGRGPIPGAYDAPFQRGLRVEPAPGQTVIVSYSTKPTQE